MLLNFAPRKLGSFEDWLVALCAEARGRGHHLEFFGRGPVHPRFHRALTALGSRWMLADALEARPLEGIRRLGRYDALYLNMVSVRNRLAYLAYAATPAKVLMADHSSRVPSAGPAWKERARTWADRAAAARLTAIAGVSEYVRRRDVAHFGWRPERIRTVYNGVDVARFSGLPREPEGAPIFLCVAHLIRHKGVHHLLDAFAPHRDRARLWIAGDGPEAGALQAQAKALGLADGVEFLGLRDDVDALLHRADAFVHPATWEEAFGLTLIEAMASARPVIASRIGGIPEIIEDGTSGLLVPPGDVRALSGALTRLLDAPELRRSLAREGRARVIARFSIDRCVREHLDFLEDFVTPGLRAQRVEDDGEAEVIRLPTAETRDSGQVAAQPDAPPPAP